MQMGNYALQLIFRCRKILTQNDFIALINYNVAFESPMPFTLHQEEAYNTS